MRISTLSMFLCLMAFYLNAQKVVVNSPASISGGYQYTPTNSWGADLTTDVWTADAVFVRDGTTDPTFGCEALTNGSEVAGKIALVDRGTCNFSVKALNAQNAGAIGLVVLNSAAGTILPSLGAGTGSEQVTIPVVMLSYADGQRIKAAMAAGTVNISMGTFRVNNDVSTDLKNIVNAPNGVVPASQVDGSGDYLFSPGAIITNTGLNPMTNVGIGAKVEHTGSNGIKTTVYENSEAGADLLSDSAAFFVLTDYDAGAQGEGLYEVTYTVTSGDTDEYLVDNTLSTSFVLSDNVYCKSRWDFANNRPATTNYGYTVAGGGNVEFITGYHVKNGVGNSLDSVTFHLFTNPGSLEGTRTTVYIYEWDDLDGDGGYNNDELRIVGFNFVDYPAGSTSVWTTLPILDFSDPDFKEGLTIPRDDIKYLVGLRFEGSITAYFSFDQNYDLGPLLSVLDNKGTLSTLDFPYYVVSSWDPSSLLPNVDDGGLFTGVRFTISSALYINPVNSSTTQILTENEVKLNLFPNPVSDVLSAKVDLVKAGQFLEYSITDASGKKIFEVRSKNLQNDLATFRVSSLPAGSYHFTVRTDYGIYSKGFSVNR